MIVLTKYMCLVKFTQNSRFLTSRASLPILCPVSRQLHVYVLLAKKKKVQVVYVVGTCACPLLTDSIYNDHLVANTSGIIWFHIATLDTGPALPC
jgi:hypothetical protein